MEGMITLIAALLGLLTAVVVMLSEFSRRKNKTVEKEKIIVQVVYPPDIQKDVTPVPAELLSSVKIMAEAPKMPEPEILASPRHVVAPVAPTAQPLAQSQPVPLQPQPEEVPIRTQIPAVVSNVQPVAAVFQEEKTLPVPGTHCIPDSPAIADSHHSEVAENASFPAKLRKAIPCSNELFDKPKIPNRGQDEPTQAKEVLNADVFAVASAPSPAREGETPALPPSQTPPSSSHRVRAKPMGKVFGDITAGSQPEEPSNADTEEKSKLKRHSGTTVPPLFPTGHSPDQSEREN